MGRLPLVELLLRLHRGRAANDGATVLVQDYHLCLLPGLLAKERADLKTVHFSHTPFADPDFFRVLPTATGRELLDGMAAASACGFHTARWAAGYLGCCADMGIVPGPTFVSPLGPNLARLQARAAADAAGKCRADRRPRRRPTGGGGASTGWSLRRLVAGFWAFDEFSKDTPNGGVRS